MLKQRTIKNEFSLSGAGLHTGGKVSLKFCPAAENTGVYFIRVDLQGRPKLKVSPENIHYDAVLPRCSILGKEPVSVQTVEHLMSVLSGLGITNLIIEIDGKELPGLDGSGIDFLKAFRKAGILEQSEQAEFYEIKEPISVESDGSAILAVPSKEFKVSYTLDYDHPFLRSQFASFVITEDTFEKEIASCRTFCLEKEAEELRKMNLGLGANYENTLVVGDDGVKNNKVRFKDEFARHKIMDFIGDLSLLGMPLRGHFFAVKSGHMLNMQLLRKIALQKEKYESRGIVENYDISGKKEILIGDIMKILPHRYPFLLVDRVIEIEKGRRAVGIKNVTINDNFFQGHFPTRAVMPGVLMVEAMAQTGGVVVLTNEAHRGKVAFFMAADNVKFRKVVIPGDQLIMEVEVIKDKSKIAQVHAVSKVNGEVVAEADMVFSFTDASYLD